MKPSQFTALPIAASFRDMLRSRIMNPEGWPVSRIFRHSVVRPHPPPPQDYNNFMLWVRANPRPLLLFWPPHVGMEKWSWICSSSKHSWDIADIWYSWDIFNHWVTTVISWLCFELEQIQDHFSTPTWGGLKSKSGLGFALTQSIKKFF